MFNTPWTVGDSDSLEFAVDEKMSAYGKPCDLRCHPVEIGSHCRLQLSATEKLRERKSDEENKNNFNFKIKNSSIAVRPI